ncbi:MAG: hormogonium polysaccharide secretion pseudopilin HpsC [Coleofasciculus sp. G3-WIS-01]|uniref:hormogonium polysaccharide secretion pseudopilin HpsC n=1 Tax=Coleofasciculus sp. G3-WIS-01 TaxID=3069528 RepID=UPI0032F91C98
MVNILRVIRKSQYQSTPCRQGKKPRGFTLIELLVAIILASLIITPLLGFMINFLQTDRREQAKTTSEQDIQSAIDYIAQDLRQAVYIYDNDGLTNTGNNGIQDQIPSLNGFGCPAGATTCQPVLVFWKRQFLEKNATDSAGTTVGDITQNNDAFVYALVGYYLIEGGSGIWSNAARIGRFEIRNGIQTSRQNSNQTSSPKFQSDPAFQMFNLNAAGTLEEKMNQWNNSGTTTNFNVTTTLVDYVDQSSQTFASCNANEQRVGTKGFVACVDTGSPNNPTDLPGPSSARVYLRGNAFARLQNTNNQCTPERSSYCPTATIQVKANGFLYTK